MLLQHIQKAGRRKEEHFTLEYTKETQDGRAGQSSLTRVASGYDYGNQIAVTC